MSKTKKDMSFENKMKRLEEIVTQIERSDVELEDSIKLFEEGVELSKDCQGLLDNAEKKVKTLVTNGATTETKDFNG